MDLAVVAVSSLITLAAAATWIWLKRSKRSLLPPGPAGLPFIGNLHQLGPLPHQTFAHLSKTFGPLMSVRLGSRPMIVVSSPSMAMHILHTLDKTFSGRPTHISAPHHLFIGRSILFSQPGPYLKLMRQICTSDLFTTKAIEHSRPLRARERHAFLLSIFASRGSPVSIRKMLYPANTNTIFRMTMGKPLQELGSSAGNPGNSSSIPSLLSELLYLLGQFNVGDFIPSLAWMDLQGYGKRSKQVGWRMKSVLQAVIEDRRRRKRDHEDGTGTSQRPDLLDLLLSASADPKHEALEDSDIRAVLLDMLVGATDSSSLTVEWALAELLANPKTLRKVQEELKENIGMFRFVEETDIPNLPYLRAVVNETLRLHIISLPPHMSLEACNISSYHIPANTVVYINLWAIHRDPSVWDDPLEFRPERFLNNSSSDTIAGKNFEFLPFGYGRRGCVGWKLGLLNVQSMLANLLHAFEWTSPKGKPQLNETSNGIAVALENPLIVVPTPRLSLSLYAP